MRIGIIGGSGFYQMEGLTDIEKPRSKPRSANRAMLLFSETLMGNPLFSCRDTVSVTGCFRLILMSARIFTR